MHLGKTLACVVGYRRSSRECRRETEMFHGVKKSLKHFFARITEIDQPIARVHILYPALNIKMQLQGSNACGARTGAVGSGGSVHFLCNTTGTVHVDAKLVYKGYNLQLLVPPFPYSQSTYRSKRFVPTICFFVQCWFTIDQCCKSSGANVGGYVSRQVCDKCGETKEH